MTPDAIDTTSATTAPATFKVFETVVFNDYTQPNEALERGEIDANAFQHKPYLDNQIKTQGYHIVPVGYTGVWPIGLYSKKHAKVADLPEGAVIGLPNDPSNEGRALHVLEHEGLIKLKDGTGILVLANDNVRPLQPGSCVAIGHVASPAQWLNSGPVGSHIPSGIGAHSPTVSPR